MLLPPPLDPAQPEKEFVRLSMQPDGTVKTVEFDEGEGPTAFVDVETTGLDPSRHEIVEIGLVLVDGPSRSVLVEHHQRVRPQRIGRADPEALAINGYNEADWKTAVPLRDAMASLFPLLEGSILAGHHVSFDERFLRSGFSRAGLPLPAIARHRLDTASLAWPLLQSGAIRSVSLSDVCAYLGIPRPRPHRALDDARASKEVAFRLMDRLQLGGRIESLPTDERAITTTLLDRLDAGRKQYGAWNVHDGRDYEHEALEEVLDGLHYLAAALVKRRKAQEGRRRRVYVCHPFASDPAGNIERVRAISQRLIDEGVLPIAPHLYLPQLLDEGSERERALSLGLELLATCDEVHVFGDLVTAGMERELREAKRLGIPARFVREVRA
jgi:DNA polymerase-3 subunit epsilon